MYSWSTISLLEYATKLAKKFLKDMGNYVFPYKEVMLYLNKIKGVE